jgi:hypothetical protein
MVKDVRCISSERLCSYCAVLILHGLQELVESVVVGVSVVCCLRNSTDNSFVDLLLTIGMTLSDHLEGVSGPFFL